jgi:small subunit ribosomal protein S1
VNVLILEIDGERRRLSLSLKRVEEGAVPVPRADGAESVHSTPDLKLSEEAFPTGSAAAVDDEADLDDVADESVAEAEGEEAVAEAEVVEAIVEVEETEEPEVAEPVAEAEPEVEPEAASDEPAAEAEADETA